MVENVYSPTTGQSSTVLSYRKLIPVGFLAECGGILIAFFILEWCYRAVQKHVSNQSTNIQEWSNICSGLDSFYISADMMVKVSKWNSLNVIMKTWTQLNTKSQESNDSMIDEFGNQSRACTQSQHIIRRKLWMFSLKISSITKYSLPVSLLSENE